MSTLNTGALGETRTRTPFGATPSRWCVYQFHHQGLLNMESRVGFEPTSGFRPPGLQSGALGHSAIAISKLVVKTGLEPVTYPV